MPTVEARAPCRVDLAGGTLDIWPLGLLHPGAITVNVAVGVWVQVTLSERESGWEVVLPAGEVELHTRAELLDREDTALIGRVAEHFALPPARIELHSESPQGAGLGASSALTVALIAACESFLGHPTGEVEATAHLARDLEAALMSLPTGIQDHYPALLGGALAIHHQPGGERVESLPVDLDALGRQLIVVYSGHSHFSAGNNFDVVCRRLRGDSETTAGLGEIAATSQQMASALARAELEVVGRLMTEEWQARRRLSEVISTPEVEEILELAHASGALGGKVCGAGGGGCVALLCPPERRKNVESAVIGAGYRLLAAAPTASSLELSSDAPEVGFRL